jgi:hypothetical protein
MKLVNRMSGLIIQLNKKLQEQRACGNCEMRINLIKID